MRIDIWSDLVCPFCTLGKRHLSLALAEFPHADEVEIVWHSYELDRNAPAVDPRSAVEVIATKYGTTEEATTVQMQQMARSAAEVGLRFNWQELVNGNTYDAHRLLHFARIHGREDELMAVLMDRWYSHGAALGDHDTLRQLAVEVGLDETRVNEVLGSDEFGIDVRTDEALATQIGITAVPTFILDQKYLVQGAQPVPSLLAALNQVYADKDTPPTPRAEGCGDSCGCGDGPCGDASPEPATTSKPTSPAQNTPQR